MKKAGLTILLLFVVVFLLPTNALAKELHEDKVVLGGSFVLYSGEVLDGNLVVLGGAVDLQNDSEVIGDVMLLGGTLQINGRIRGSLLGLGGVIDIKNDAFIHGDVVTIAAVLHRSQNAHVLGQVITGFRLPRLLSLPKGVETSQLSHMGFHISSFSEAIWFLLRAFLWSALGLLIVMFLPDATQRVTRALVMQPFLSGGLGLLVALVAPILLIGIAITILLIPISLVGILVLALAWVFGRIALGLEIGKRLGDLLNQRWTPPIAAGVGTFILTLIVDGAGQFIPCIGWVLPTFAGLFGFGAVLLTRFGTQIYPPEAGTAPVESTLAPTINNHISAKEKLTDSPKEESKT